MQTPIVHRRPGSTGLNIVLNISSLSAGLMAIAGAINGPGDILAKISTSYVVMGCGRRTLWKELFD